MKEDVETRAAALLRREDAAAVPVQRLHRALVAEWGPRSGTYGELGTALRRRPDLFVLLEPADPLGTATAWSPELRAEYEAALREAGVDSGPRVALAEARPPWPAVAVTEDTPEDIGSIARMEASLVALWTAARGDGEIRARIADALRESEEIRLRLAE
jgi:hypothetical protein